MEERIDSNLCNRLYGAQYLSLLDNSGCVTHEQVWCYFYEDEHPWIDLSYSHDTTWKICFLNILPVSLFRIGPHSVACHKGQLNWIGWSGWDLADCISFTHDGMLILSVMGPDVS